MMIEQTNAVFHVAHENWIKLGVKLLIDVRQTKEAVGLWLESAPSVAFLRRTFDFRSQGTK
jgi:hypothetical protein